MAKDSPVGSIKGWDWKLWLAAHWLDIKKAVTSPSFNAVFKPVAKYLIAWMVLHGVTDNIAAEGILTLLGKSVLDFVDFWLSHQKL